MKQNDPNLMNASMKKLKEGLEAPVFQTVKTAGLHQSVISWLSQLVLPQLSDVRVERPCLLDLGETSLRGFQSANNNFRDPLHYIARLHKS